MFMRNGCAFAVAATWTFFNDHILLLKGSITLCLYTDTYLPQSFPWADRCCKPSTTRRGKIIRAIINLFVCNLCLMGGSARLQRINPLSCRPAVPGNDRPAELTRIRTPASQRCCEDNYVQLESCMVVNPFIAQPFATGAVVGGGVFSLNCGLNLSYNTPQPIH